jgi:hypothetical protein
MCRLSHVSKAKWELPGSDAKKENKNEKSRHHCHGSADLVVQLAAAASKHHQSTAQQTAVQQQRNNADAYASWPAGRAGVYEPGPNYSGGYSAPAGR